MRWHNHKLVSFWCIYALTGGLVASFMSMLGAVLPDVAEFGGLVKHRTMTHVLTFWMVTCVCAWLAFKNSGFASLPLYLFFFLLCGCLLHVLEDSLSNGGIPLLMPFGFKFGFGFYKTGTLSESFTVCGLLLIFGIFSYKRGFFGSEHFEKEMHRLMYVLGF